MAKQFLPLAIAATLAAPLPAFAADHVVKMLSSGSGGQTMVFEPAYLNVAVGDTVVFTPAQKAGHNTASLLVPDGGKPWKGGYDVETRVKIDKEGVYLYACEPHKMMGMVGVIQAGKAANLAAAKAAAQKEQAAFAMNKDRFDKALALAK